MTEPTLTPAPPPGSRRIWYYVGAGVLALLILIFVQGLARGIWHAIGGLVRLVWMIGRVLWHLILPG